MTERLLIVVAAVALGFAVVALWERRPTRRRGAAGNGVTLVVGPGCRVCPQAIAALDRHGIQPTILDFSQASHLGVRSVPTVFVTADDGRVLLRRSGRSAVTDAPRIAEAALVRTGARA